MSINDVFAGSLFVSAIVDLIATRGITLEFGSDFSEFQEALKDQPERHSLSPRFDPRSNDLDEETAFWITGRDAQGEIVHTQAVRTVDLGGLTLGSYLAAKFRDFTPADYAIDKSQSRYRGAPGSRAIAGKVCYHGELWLKGGPGGYRGAGMTAVLARLAIVTSLLKWAPDYIFGFMFPLAACKGLAAREGYMHTEPGTLYWALPGQEELMEIWTVWMGREDIRHLLHIPPAALFEQLEAGHRRREKAA